MKAYKLILILFVFTFINTSAQNVSVNNVTFQQRTDGSFFVDVYYDLTLLAAANATVTMQASSDSGSTWTLICNSISGDAGSNITAGTNKHIVWDFAADNPGFYSNKVVVKVIADDGVFECGTPILYSGKTYNTVLIGSQCWLKENLNVGTYIPSTNTGTTHSDASNNGIIEKYCYGNDTINCDTYGGLYDWNEAMQYVTTPGTQGICPPGWHIPTLAEFETLKSAVGNDGNALKAVGQGTGAGAGTNTSGFSVLLAGYRFSDGYFNYFSSYAFFWSSTESNGDASDLSLISSDSNIYLGKYSQYTGFSVRCLKDGSSPTPPTVTTTTISNITANSASSGGNVTSQGSSSVTARGVCWSTNQNPTISDNKTTDGTGTGSFTSSITGLTASTTYYVRAYAANSAGTSYGSQENFTTTSSAFVCGTSTVTYSGKTYNTVLIGSQCWLKENLNVGTYIPSTNTGTTHSDASNNGIIEKYCYNNDTTNCDTYGGLYDWNEAMQYVTTPGTQGICPPGWHIPTLAEFETLKSAVGNDGNALKAVGQGTGAGAGTNISGFSALLAGDRPPYGYFHDFGYHAYFWSTNEDNTTTDAYSLSLRSIDGSIDLGDYDKYGGFSVRCLKNVSTIELNSPNGGENWTVGTSQNITWTSTAVANVKLEYTTDNGTNWTEIISSVAASLGSYSWTIPNTPSTSCKVKISSTDNASNNDISNNVFIISSGVCNGITSISYAGQNYNTVAIGSQCWLKENLNIGTRIDGSISQSNNSTIEKYCYDNLESNCDTYGGLYQWNEAMQYVTTPGTQGMCPDGWHIPTLPEFQALSNAVGNDGNALKAVGQGTGGGAGTNTSGFSILLAGYRGSNGSFYDLGYYSRLWISTESSSVNAKNIDLHDNSSIIDFANNNKEHGFSVRCLKDGSSPTPPTVTTTSISNITSNLASSGGNVTSQGSSSVTARGVCWSTNQNPTISDNKTADGTGTGSFTSSITGLTASTTYYVRAYATNSVGTSYGSQVSFTTTSQVTCPPNVIYSGKTYNTVLIGSQCWLKENLNVGTRINGSGNQINNSTIEKYCYDDLESSCNTYGGLYQWNEAMQYVTTPGTQGICPPGWHIPTLAEFETLKSAVGNDGNALKAVGQGTGAGAGTNTSGFAALLTGQRNYSGYFEYLASNTYYWSSIEYFTDYAYYLYLSSNNSSIYLYDYTKIYGLSVRCLKD